MIRPMTGAVQMTVVKRKKNAVAPPSQAAGDVPSRDSDDHHRPPTAPLAAFSGVRTGTLARSSCSYRRKKKASMNRFGSFAVLGVWSGKRTAGIIPT